MRILLFSLLLSIQWTLLSDLLCAQTQEPDLRTVYLKQISKHQTSLGVEQALTKLLATYPTFLPTDDKRQIASFFSFVLTLNGYTNEKLHALNEEGLSVAHAITANKRPLVEQALLADLVIQGTVVGDTLIDGEPGELLREIRIRVDDLFKGSLASDEIIIRQRNGREYGANPARAASLDEGKTYLLLLSNGLFRFALFSSNQSIEESQLPAYANYYSIYRHYEMDGERILWDSLNKRKSKKALSEIRWLDGFGE